MSETGWYYLHTNGQLIHKKTDPGADDSDFVRRVWTFDTSKRSDAWRILVEAAALGAQLDRLKELAAHWSCDGRDLVEFIMRLTHPNPEQVDGMHRILGEVLGYDPNEYWDWLAATPKGKEPDFDSMPKPRREEVPS